ncbi:MAG: hypothetical protein ACI8RZ_000281 [Myxococcota bacterium]|jgi:uncharacterized protein YqgC (DUF456 family)
MVPAIVFGVLGLICTGLVLVGLPGAWILLAIGVAIEMLDHLWAGDGFTTFGWLPLGLSVLVLGLGEVFELATGAVGTKLGGGTRRGMVGAFLGGMVGGIVGTGIFPVVGTLIGAFLGTFIGAMVGESTGPNARKKSEAIGPALAATAGRVIGTVIKLGAAMAVWWGLLGVMVYRLVA